MAVTYKNREGRLYFLCQGITRTGRPRYYFALEPKDAPVEKLPEGYEVQESVNGIVSLIRIQPNLLSCEDIAAVEAAIQARPQAKRYRLAVKARQITVYEQVGLDAAELAAKVGFSLKSAAIAELEAITTQFRPIMRFTLTNDEQRLFTAERMCFRGSIDGWIELDYEQPAPALAARLIPALGTDDFYELF